MIRFGFSIFFIFFSLNLFATQELQRVDTLVESIAQLRESYEEELLAEREKVQVLQKKLKSLEKEIISLKNSQKPKKNSQKSQGYVEKNFPAMPFNLLKDAPIYASPTATKVLQEWKKGTSFTSHVRSANRIKITGYFVDKVWQKAEDELWIDTVNVAKKVTKE
jgi:alanyl-tRNA synthetase